MRAARLDNAAAESIGQGVTMQKLVTIFLSDDNDDDIEIEEHLVEYLDEGWRVAQLLPIGAGAGYGSGGDSETEGHCYVAGWLAVLLERDDE